MERLGARDWIRFIPCVSEEPAGASAARHGTAIEVAIRYGVLADQTTRAGRPRMVDATVDGLEAGRLPAGFVTSTSATRRASRMSDDLDGRRS